MKRIFAFIISAMIIAATLGGCAVNTPGVDVSPWVTMNPNMTVNPAISPPGY